jgi:ABC-type uncharacterized transport system YnjBCD substrate-binding protein
MKENSVKEKPVLSDKDLYPSPEVIHSYIGKNGPLWDNFFEYLHTNQPDISEEWRYYNDGKSWLLKVVRKKNTVCWVSLYDNTFRITFYFTDKAEEAILNSSIPDKLKKDFTEGKKFGKIRGVTIIFKTKKDLQSAIILLNIKLNMK